jgi:hypothetical protein
MISAAEMTISFDVMMKALKIQLASSHYLHVHRGLLTLCSEAQFDLIIILTAEFQSHEFNSTHDFVKRQINLLRV